MEQSIEHRLTAETNVLSATFSVLEFLRDHEETVWKPFHDEEFVEICNELFWTLEWAQPAVVLLSEDADIGEGEPVERTEFDDRMTLIEHFDDLLGCLGNWADAGRESFPDSVPGPDDSLTQALFMSADSMWQAMFWVRSLTQRRILRSQTNSSG